MDDIEDIAQRIAGFLEMQKPEGLLDKLKMIPKLGEISAAFPKMVSGGACKEVIRRKDFSLDEFPILHCWPGDGGRFITLPMVFSKDPNTGKRNCGMYRMQVFDGQTTGMHWQKSQARRRSLSPPRRRRQADAHADRRCRRLRPCHALLRHFAAAARYRRNAVCRLFARQSVEMVKCETCDIEVPANSEIVLEGYLNLGELRARRSIRRPHRLLFAG